jgi:hypothetical protein
MCSVVHWDLVRVDIKSGRISSGRVSRGVHSQSLTPGLRVVAAAALLNFAKDRAGYGTLPQ